MEMNLLLNQGSEIWIAHICPYGTTRYGPAHTIYRQYQMRLFDLLNDRKASNQIFHPTTHETKIRRPNYCVPKSNISSRNAGFIQEGLFRIRSLLVAEDPLASISVTGKNHRNGLQRSGIANHNYGPLHMYYGRKILRVY